MTLNNYFSLEIPSTAENIGVARITVATFASQLDFTLSEIDEIKVAVNEAMTNAVIHAYKESSTHNTVIIQASIYADDLLEINVTDRGQGIPDVEQALEPSYTTTEDRMGLGLTFIDSFMDDFYLHSQVGKGTEVMMTKRPQAKAGLNPKVEDSGQQAGEAGS